MNSIFIPSSWEYWKMVYTSWESAYFNTFLTESLEMNIRECIEIKTRNFVVKIA